MSDSPATEKKRPENLLFHSRIEICRIMQMLASEHSPVTAEIKGHPFSSHIISVDVGADHFAIAFSTHKVINAMVLNSPSVEFTATDHQALNFTFVAAAPEETLIDGEHMIQFTLPKSLLLHNRREYTRKLLDDTLSLRCVADEAGFIPFESYVTDVSHDGLGCLIYDMDVNLEPHTILKGCRIVTRDGDAVTVDMELRHITTVPQPDGSLLHRAGFRFVQAPAGNAKLVGLFIEDLDKK